LQEQRIERLRHSPGCPAEPTGRQTLPPRLPRQANSRRYPQNEKRRPPAVNGLAALECLSPAPEFPRRTILKVGYHKILTYPSGAELDTFGLSQEYRPTVGRGREETAALFVTGSVTGRHTFDIRSWVFRPPCHASLDAAGMYSDAKRVDVHQSPTAPNMFGWLKALVERSWRFKCGGHGLEQRSRPWLPSH